MISEPCPSQGAAISIHILQMCSVVLFALGPLYARVSASEPCLQNPQAVSTKAGKH